MPWYMRLIETHGISTFFAVILLFGGWKLMEKQLQVLDEQATQSKLQTEQMELQSETLQTIAETTRRSSESNQRQEGLLREVGENLDEGIERSARSHEQILEKLKEVHP